MRTIPTWSVTALQVLGYLWLFTLMGEIESRSYKSAYGEGFQARSIHSPRKLPCPDPDDIRPCICSIGENYAMNMDCSNITSEQQLEEIFHTDFPFDNFNKLEITNNSYLEVLRAGVLGNATFTEINIKNCALHTIQDGVFAGSHATLEALRLNGNNISTTAENISLFTNLEYLSIQSSLLKEFPSLISPSLRILILDGNHFDSIPDNAIKLLPSLKVVSLGDCSVSEIMSGAFTQNEKLEVVQLASNNLSSLHPNTIHLHGPNTQLSLHNNHITTLHLESFKGVELILEMDQNSLKELEEEVWRQPLENDAWLTLSDNPFICGCDIAWLILNRTLLERVADVPTCSDGEAFVDLDPEIYETLC